MLAVPSVPLIACQPKITPQTSKDSVSKSRGIYLEFCQSFHTSLFRLTSVRCTLNVRRARWGAGGSSDRRCVRSVKTSLKVGSNQSLGTQSLHLLHISTWVIWHIVSQSFNECLVSLMTSKRDSLVLGLKRKVLCIARLNPTVSKVAIMPPYSPPLLDLQARLNYPTTFTRRLTAVLAGVSFPDVLTSPDGKLVGAASHQLQHLTSSTNMAFH